MTSYVQKKLNKEFYLNKSTKSLTANMIREDNEKKRQEAKQQLAKKYGGIKELVNLGKEDRIKGIKPCPDNYSHENEQTSYSYGYFELGSKTLAGFFTKNKISKEEQSEIGKRDFENGLPEEYLTFFKDFPSYIEGYRSQKAFSLGAKDYHYIRETGIELIDYIDFMQMFEPLVSIEAYRQGYESEKAKYEQTSSKKIK